MRLLHLLQWLGSSHRPPLAQYGIPSPSAPGLAPESIRSVLWVRTDAIGDAVLAMDQLRVLGQAFPGAGIHVVCQENVAELYRACPWAASVLPFERRRFRRDRRYRAGLLAAVRALAPDLALNGVYSRETLTDALTLGSGAGIRCAWAGSRERAAAWKLALAERFYTHVFAGRPEGLELDRNRAFLVRLGLDPTGYAPRVWLAPEDRAFAQAWMRDHGLDGAATVVLFAGALKDVRHYGGFGQALALAFPGRQATLLALGAAADRERNQQALEAYGGPSVNACGATTLRQAAALIQGCRLAVGAETGLMHLAAAVGTPHAVVLGGGHFGRFAPCSPLTSAACLPLSCYGCDWRCPYARAHCVAEVPPGTLARAIRDAWAGPDAQARLYRPQALPALPAGGPAPAEPPAPPGSAWR